VIFFGPPGTGKSALAKIIARKTKSEFVETNAVTVGVNEIRKIIDLSYKRYKVYNKKTILLLDEIHHFNRSQQDALLPDVEKGMIILVGITTENPYFYVNSALLSRSTVFEFKPLSKEDLNKVINRALTNKEKGLGKQKINMTRDAVDHILNYSEGDARRILNSIEIGVLTTPADKNGVIHFDLKTAEESIQHKSIVYDKTSDAHYDHISAYIKSLRGSDPDAALYWLVKMLAAGEDPRFIARRLIIAASEDVGNANPNAVTVATSILKAVEFVGMPEARIPLAQGTVYIATAPKSNAAYEALQAAETELAQGKLRDVPIHLRDATADGDKLGHGKGYKYPHSFPGHHVVQEYMPDHKIFYTPSDQGYEIEIKKRLDQWRLTKNRTKETK
jgi:putative ATPase